MLKIIIVLLGLMTFPAIAQFGDDQKVEESILIAQKGEKKIEDLFKGILFPQAERKDLSEEAADRMEWVGPFVRDDGRGFITIVYLEQFVAKGGHFQEHKNSPFARQLVDMGFRVNTRYRNDARALVVRVNDAEFEDTPGTEPGIKWIASVYDNNHSLAFYMSSVQCLALWIYYRDGREKGRCAVLVQNEKRTMQFR